ncbi:hypothetical protein H0H93_008370 [Arthromyces matolae]|nr:hypothetical protein H0H93_008370 [Arthromyces matolae]
MSAFGNFGTASANPLFGGLPKPADTSAAKPSGAGLFGQTTSSAGAPSTLGATGGLFSQPAKPDATSASTTTPSTAAPNPLFGGSLFGAKTGTTPAATVSPTPTPTTSETLSQRSHAAFQASTPAPSNFFANTVTKPAEQQKDGPSTGCVEATTTTSTSSILGGGLFGAKPPADAAGMFQLAFSFSATLSPSKATTTSSGGLFGKPAEKKDGSLLPAAATSTSTTTPAAGVTALTNVSVAVAPPSTLKGKTLEEIVNKWTTDLETHVKEFNKFATEVAVWDRALIENSNTLAALYSHVEAAEKEQADIDQSLDHIEAQQNELAGVLTTYEKMSQDILGSQAGGMRALDTGPADTERDKNYMLATDLHTHLDDLSGSLTQMIDSVNALSLPSIDSAPTEDPMSQIAQILSSHLESLQWIDGAVRDVEGKIVEVEQRVKENGHTMPSSNQKTSRAFGSNR